VNITQAAAIAGAVGSMMLGITGCQGSQNGSAESSSPTSSAVSASSTTSTPAAASPNAVDPLAVEILDAITRGDFDAATARFDDQMKRKLPPQDLASSWRTYQEAFGTYQTHGGPQDVPLGDLTVVNIPLEMQREPGEFRVTFHPDQSVAGLWLLKPGTPVA